MNKTINLFENIICTIWMYNVAIYFIPGEIPGFVLPVLSFLTMLVFICVAPYVVHREGYNLIIFSYFCSSSLVFNFYMRSDFGLSWMKHNLLFIVAQATNHALFWIYCTLRKEARSAYFFYFHARLAAIFEAIFVIDLYFIYSVLFSANKEIIYQEMMQRHLLIMDKVMQARRRYEYELDGDRMFDPEFGGSEHFLALGPPPPPYVQ